MMNVYRNLEMRHDKWPYRLLVNVLVVFLQLLEYSRAYFTLQHSA